MRVIQQCNMIDIACLQVLEELGYDTCVPVPRFGMETERIKPKRVLFQYGLVVCVHG